MEENRSRTQHVNSVNQQQVMLPNDLATVILELLPVKSLLRFKCVSKWWYNLIKTDHIFAINQLKHVRNKSRMLLVLKSHPNHLSFHDLDSPELKQVRPNLSISNSGKSIKKCLGGLWSNGIVCIVYNDCITLCNPALREFKSLPPPRFAGGNVWRNCFCGFGITCTGEFKVIIIEGEKSVTSFPAHLYSTSTDSWKQICDAPHWIFFDRELYFNGACHWFAHDHEHIILAFNMSTEVFMQLKLPDGLNNRLYRHTGLIVINDCLSIVQLDHDPWVQQSIAYDVWVMKAYGIKESWTKQYVIRPQMYIFMPFFCWKNDEWLLMERNGHLASISFLTNEIKFYQVGIAQSIAIYEESLISLN